MAVFIITELCTHPVINFVLIFPTKVCFSNLADYKFTASPCFSSLQFLPPLRVPSPRLCHLSYHKHWNLVSNWLNYQAVVCS
jgi:hypothetical protein